MSRFDRRDLLLRTAQAFPALAAGWTMLSSPSRAIAYAVDDPERTAVEFMTPETQQAIDRGLTFLASEQDDNGSFGSGGYSRNVAVCGLAGMAFMSAGSTPGRGPYGDHVERCIDFILANTQESGFINVPGTSSHGPMYGHGFATLFLAEAYGMTQRGRHSRQADQGREPDRQHAEQRRRLALSAGAARRRHFGDDLPGDGAARRAQRRLVRAARDDRPLHRVRQAEPERRRRLHVHDPRRAKRVSRARPPASWRSTAPASTKGRRSRRGSTT